MREWRTAEWESNTADDEVVALLTELGATEVAIRYHLVRDGSLRAMRVCMPPDHLWHLSVTHTPKKPRRGSRAPTWEELIDARTELMPANIDVILHLENAETDRTFHLYELRSRSVTEEVAHEKTVPLAAQRAAR